MSNVNDYSFAKELDKFMISVIMPNRKKVKDAEDIMNDPNYKWTSDDQRKTGQARLDNYHIWLKYYEDFYVGGMELVKQHEQLVNNLAKWYAIWFTDVSNEGKQEAEIMEGQADLLQQIFTEIYKELKPLKLDVGIPKALNL